MIRRLVAGAVRQRLLVLGVTAAFVIAATAVALRLELDALPDLTNNQVLVLTRAPGLTPEEVELRVTRPIETVLGGLPGLEHTRSLSRYGISSVTAIFEDDVDPYRARQIVSERLAPLGGKLPLGVEAPELGPVTGGLGEIYHFTLSSSSRTPAELLELATYRVAPILRAVPGVVEVNSWGGAERTIEVVADPLRLGQRGLVLEDLQRALGRAVGSVPGTSLPAGTGQALLRGVARPVLPVELAGAIVVAPTAEAPAVRVADVAELREGMRPRIGAATANGGGETVYLMAQMLRGANALEVTDRLHGQLGAVRSALPEDVVMDLVYDRSVLVLQTLRTVGKNLLEGGALVILVLFAMLGSLRAGLLVALAIPLSMLGALLGMVLLGVPGNLMSLGAIDFGLLVDGAVVMVEHLFHQLGKDREAHARHGERDVRHRVSHAVQAVASPVFFSVLIILLVYVPVLSLSGVDGKMFRPMALTVVFALTTSLVLSLTFVPAAASLFLRPRDVPERPPLLIRLVDRLYHPLLDRVRRHPAVVALGALLVLALGVGLYLRAGSEFAPQLDEGDLVVQTTRAPDVRLDTAVVEAARLEVAALAIPEVRQVVSRIGSPAVATDIMGIEQADVFVALRPRQEWRPGLSREGLIDELHGVIDQASPGSDPAFTQPIQMRFNELLGGAVTDVALSVVGDDLATIRRLADRAAGRAREVTGAVDVRVLAPPDVALAEVRPRPLDAALQGLSVEEVLAAVQALRSGITAGVSYDGPVPLPIVLRLGGSPTVFQLGDQLVPRRGGGVVPLARIADVDLGRAPGLVSHQDGERRLVVGFNVRGADLGEVVTAVQARLASGLQVPRGYRLVWGGQYETLADARRRLTVVVPMVLALILGVLFIAFRRLRPAFIIFTHVPFAGVGGLVALAVRGMPLSISAAIGFIALSGIAVMNGVVLVSRILGEETQGHDPATAAVLAARTRARPVLMTALVAALGFVPMMLARGVGAEVQRPLSTVVVGGLVSSTLLTLLVLPTLYPWLAGRRSIAADAPAPRRGRAEDGPAAGPGAE